MRRSSPSRQPVPVTTRARDGRSMPPSRRQGAILIIIACGATLFLGLLALVTDVGWTYFHQIKLQTAINAGWKAGFDELLALRASREASGDKADLDRVAAHIRSVVTLNYPDTPSPEVTVTFGKKSPDRPNEMPGLTVFGTHHVPLFFANIFGISIFRVQAMRTSTPPQGEDPTLIPLAIPHGEVKEPQSGMYRCTLFSEHQGFEPGSEYLLKPGQTFASSALGAPSPEPGLKHIQNTGAIDPDNLPQTGDAEFAARLENGFHQPLQIHDRIILQPDITADTISSRIASRIASGAARAIFPITDIPPEVASGAENFGAQTIYDLKGMDAPEGKYSPDEYTFSAAARIIGFAEFELMKPTESDHGQIRGRFIRYIIKPGIPVNGSPTKGASE